MAELYRACRTLFETAFPDGAKDWNDALFQLAMPNFLRVIQTGEHPDAMLFSIPYAIKTAENAVDARYLYAVATDPALRGRGLATALLKRVIAEGYPVFLRPSSDTLFDFYQRAGLVPVSPFREEGGSAADAPPPDGMEILRVTPAAYLLQREKFLRPPFAAPSAEFLSLAFLYGGAVAADGRFAALFEWRQNTVYFKEWLGDRALAPYAAAYLGAAAYRLRTPAEDGRPFGMAANCPGDLQFLIALD